MQLTKIAIFVALSAAICFAQETRVPKETGSQTSKGTRVVSSTGQAPKIETVPMDQVTILRLENIQLRMELLKRDLQDIASGACASANISKESCRINSASGTLSGEKISVDTKK